MYVPGLRTRLSYIHVIESPCYLLFVKILLITYYSLLILLITHYS